jgi:hypothetical protein
MPRPIRRVQETPESRTLDVTAREYNRVEARLFELRERLQRDVVAAVKAGMSKAEAGRRAGYSREYVSRLVADSDSD